MRPATATASGESRLTTLTRKALGGGALTFPYASQACTEKRAVSPATPSRSPTPAATHAAALVLSALTERAMVEGTLLQMRTEDKES